MSEEIKLRKYHAPVWDEPIIMEMGSKGERGIYMPEAEDEVRSSVGSAESHIPENMRRVKLPNLPELSQPYVLRHYLRLTQQIMGMETANDIGSGTCTMKYSPKVNEVLSGMHQFTEIHPFQDEDTIQGILEVMYKLELILREISGMDRFSFQPGGGAHATYTNACILRAYHSLNGELDRRTEVITSMFSHPCNAASAVAAGFNVITLPPGKNGYPEFEALKAACSKNTAGLMITNPEDTGIYNPRIDDYIKVVHDVGGLCFYDQANLNGIVGIARARDAGFDACHFNLHKTFSSPHGSVGPGCGAFGCKEELAKFLPVPVVTFDGQKYHLESDRPDSIGKVKDFFGNTGVVLRAFAWVMSMGPEGLLEVARTAVMNNNYLIKLLMEVPGISLPYAEGKRRLDQARFSFEKLYEDTGVGTFGVLMRMVDYGIQNYFPSHVPFIVPEPMTPEPCESYSKEDIEYYAAVINRVCREAYSDPDKVNSAPHNSAIHQVDIEVLDDPEEFENWYLTWRAYQKKRKNK